MSLETLLGQQVLNGLVMGAIYACMALGLTLIYGILDQVNFAHGEMYMLGAYAVLVFASWLHLPYPLAILLGMVAIAILGFLFEHGIFRPLRGTPELNTIIASLGASIFLWNLALVVFGPIPQELKTSIAFQSVQIGPLSTSVQRLLVIFVSMGIIGILYLVIMRTRIGKAMRAASQDRDIAQLMGVDIGRIAELTFMVGGALAALAGGLIAPIFLVYPSMGLMAAQKAFVVVILGGMGNVLGAITAGFFLGVVESIAAGFVSSQLRDLFAFAILVLVLWIRPEGFFGRTAKKGG